MIGHHTHLHVQDNDNLPLWQALAIKNCLFFNVHALIMRGIMDSNDAKCNTKE